MKFTTILAALVLGGCLQTACTPKATEQAGDATSEKVSYLCVGMEHSARFGQCNGCASDANNLFTLMRDQYGYSGEVLISAMATREEVVRKLQEGIANTPEDGLFLFFYSGHGGQERLGGTEPEGADSPDEYLCLYDTYLLDDEIWQIVSSCKGRVFLYFDACHSATMFRSVRSEIRQAQGEAVGTCLDDGAHALGLGGEWVMSSGFTFRPENLVKATALALEEGSSPRLLCWSGCKEAEYSYGSSRGGVLTRAVIKSWKQGVSYEKLWTDAVSRVVGEQPDQNPVATHVGSGFEEGREAFR